MSVTFMWMMFLSSGIERENKRDAFLLNSLVWNLIIQLQSDFSPYCKKVGQTLVWPCKVSSNANQPRIQMDQLTKITGAKAEMPRRKKPMPCYRPCRETASPAHTGRQMENIYFFGHPFPTAWEMQVWALESTGLDKSLLLIFLLNSNMNSSWFHPRADQKLLKSWEVW